MIAKNSPPRRGGVSAPSEAKAQTGWSDRRDVKLCRTDHPGASAARLSRHPSSARRGIGLACGIVSGILLVLSLPKPDLYPLAWVALVPWLYVISSATLHEVVTVAYAAGVVFFAGTFYWISETMAIYGGLFAGSIHGHSSNGRVDWNLWIVVCRNSGQQPHCLRGDEPQ